MDERIVYICEYTFLCGLRACLSRVQLNHQSVSKHVAHAFAVPVISGGFAVPPVLRLIKGTEADAV